MSWTSAISFTLDGDPVAQPRPSVTVRGGLGALLAISRLDFPILTP